MWMMVVFGDDDARDEHGDDEGAGTGDDREW